MNSIDEIIRRSRNKRSNSPSMPQFVNLDALIPREDLEVTSDTPSLPGADVAPFTIEQLVSGQLLMHSLKKPDFQRETSNWTPEAVVELVKNFLDEELVPAVILWKSPSKDVFVIDGAHRLSALIAWVNNDYGYGGISKEFFKGQENIPKGQIEAAKATEALVESTIGSYQTLKDLVARGIGTPEERRRGKNIASVALPTQSVRNDAKHAEASFFKINQGGARISEQEIEIIRARSRPEAIAARALLRAGTGHEYWSAFEPATKEQIGKLGREVYDLLYWPPIDNEWRTLDLPIGGSGYSANALNVLYELVHLSNGLTRSRVKSSKDDKLQPLPKEDPLRDIDGADTIKRLKKTKRAVQLIMSREEFSLGLHPAVYSYSITGRFQPSAFFAQIEFFLELEQMNQLLKFSAVRREFEDFLVTHKYFTNQLVNAKGALTRSSSSIKELLGIVFSGVCEGVDESIIAQRITQRFNKLKVMEDTPPPPPSPTQKTKKRGFSKNVKTAARLHSALASAPRCEECGARMHSFGNTVDHKERQADGGGSHHSDLARVMHPFCNSGLKEHRVAMAKRASLA